MKSSLLSMKWDRIASFPWHPILLALYAPLELGAVNIGQIALSLIYRPAVFSAVFAFIILGICWWLFHDEQIAGVIASMLMVLSLSYGHIYSLIKDAEVAGFLVGRHRFLVVLWLVLACVGVWWAVRNVHRTSKLTGTLNVVSVFLVAMPVMQLVLFTLRTQDYQTVQIEQEQQSLQLQIPDGAPRRDVYYIILDAYGRTDVLKESFGFDNSAFIKNLQDLGFYVATCSQSNYSKTDLSLSSSLNLDYVTTLDPALTPDNTDRQPLWDLVKYNQVELMFRNAGYTTAAFETGFDFSQLANVNVFYSPERKGFNEFEILFVKTTLARLFDDAGLLARFKYTIFDRKYELINFDLDTLETVPLESEPTFVFAHLVIPHQPFVFGPNGEKYVIAEKELKGRTYYAKGDYEQGYHNQAAFISDRILEVIQTILERSDVAPIIIIQGDHGPSHASRDGRMGILNAYYFPDAMPALYPRITPVNSFRLLFNTYFGTQLPLLDDVSQYSDYPNAYQFEIIPNQCDPK